MLFESLFFGSKSMNNVLLELLFDSECQVLLAVRLWNFQNVIPE
jgi:hypothetical protein